MQMWTYPYLYLPSLPKSGKKSEILGPEGQSPSASSAQSQKLGPTFSACQGPGGPVRRSPAVLSGLSRGLKFHFKTTRFPSVNPLFVNTSSSSLVCKGEDGFRLCHTYLENAKIIIIVTGNLGIYLSGAS